MSNGLAMPKLVLPRAELMGQSPISALTEIRTSMSTTLANFEAALPTGAPGLPGTAAKGPKFPKIDEVFKGPTAAMKEIQSSFKETFGKLPGPISETKDKTTKVAPSPPGPTPGVTREIISRRGM